MAKRKSPNMDEKSANCGDRLKHALELEVMERTRRWPSVVYCETHAGAGVYHAGNQSEGHIRNLRRQVMDAHAGDGEAGAAYLSSLKNWWRDTANSGTYPGSAVTAMQWLKQYRQPGTFDLRVTEKDDVTCQRLRQALGAFDHGVRQASFMNQLSWLTTDDNLVLLVDPYGCVERFAASGRGLDDGWIDHSVVQDILRRCAAKERAVVSFWWGFGQALREHHRATCDLLKAWAQQQERAECRLFHDGKNHAEALVGIGVGAEVVRSLPSRDEWRRSWLADTVYESKRRVRSCSSH